MKNISFLAMFLASFCLYSQNCKLNIETDEFTGVKSTVTDFIKFTVLASPEQGKLAFAEIDGQKVVYAHILTNSVAAVDKKTPFYFKFSDGTILELHNMDYTISDANYRVLVDVFQGIVCILPLEPEQLEIFATKRLVKSRVTTTKREMIFETSTKIADNLKDCARMLSNNKQ